jgi:hypothetical protein
MWLRKRDIIRETLLSSQRRWTFLERAINFTALPCEVNATTGEQGHDATA